MDNITVFVGNGKNAVVNYGYVTINGKLCFSVSTTLNGREIKVANATNGDKHTDHAIAHQFGRELARAVYNLKRDAEEGSESADYAWYIANKIVDTRR